MTFRDREKERLIPLKPDLFSAEACMDGDYIMEAFPIVKRHDEDLYSEYRTKCVILKIYDAMQHAIETSEPYQTPIDPTPADPRVAHGG